MKKQFLALALASITACTMLSTAACQLVDNRSAYQIAVDNGFVGTEEEWLASLKGTDGVNGVDGAMGNEGKSAYELAVENGFVGTQEEWLLSIVGKTGVGIAKVEATLTNELKITMTDGTEYTVLVDHCDHEFVCATTNPTCGEVGYSTYTCDNCELSYINDYVPALGHHYVDKACFFCKEAESFGVIEVDTSWCADPSLISYEISTKNQLAGLAYLVNEGINNFSGKQINLADHIDLENAEWIPIGNEKTPFAGTFDGRNFSIKNLKISNQTNYVGLFGFSTGGLKRFSVENANIMVEHVGVHIGIACGYLKAGISDVSVSGYIIAPYSDIVGGVVGWTSRESNRCSSSANITANDYIGGIVGYMNFIDGGLNANQYMSDLTNTGNVGGSGNCVGGIFGFMTGRMWIEGKYTLANISRISNSGTISGNAQVGGLIGHVYMETTYNPYSVFKMIATEVKNSGSIIGVDQVGGFIGYAFTNGTSEIRIYEQTGEINCTGAWGDYIGVTAKFTFYETA